MKSLIILIVVSSVYFACTKEKVAKITIEATDLSEIYLSEINPLRIDTDTLQSLSVLSGKANTSLSVTHPRFVRIHAGKKSQDILLRQGYELTIIFPDSIGEVHYDGKGANANLYYQQLDKFRLNFMFSLYNRKVGIDSFKLKIDSISSIWTKYHFTAVDSLHIDAETADFLSKVNLAKIESIKSNYLWNNFNLEDEQVNSVESNIMAFDSILFFSALPDMVFSIHLEFFKNYATTLPFRAINKDSLKGIEVEFINNLIIQKNYPTYLSELFEAKNINEWMLTQGVTPALENAILDFHLKYPNSRYNRDLDALYTNWKALSSGTPAPEIKGIMVNGDQFQLSDLKGKVIYIDVWATWCAPCREEIPHAIRLQKKFTDNPEVVFLNISVDKNVEKWQEFLAAKPAWQGIHVNVDREKERNGLDDYVVAGVPQYILIDQQGKIVNAKALRPSSGDEIADLINNLINRIALQ